MYVYILKQGVLGLYCLKIENFEYTHEFSNTMIDFV